MDSLPLIPHKGGECGDTRPVLREVFREQVALPALPSPPGVRSSPAVHEQREEQQQRRRARALATSSSTCFCACTSSEESLLQRIDLLPAVHQLATKDTSLWVRATMGPAGECAGALSVRGKAWPGPGSTPDPQRAAVNRSLSQWSLSYGEPPRPSSEAVPHACLRLDRPTPPHAIPPPESVICIPQSIHFEDFTVGKLHVCYVRVMNMGNCKLRLSLSPPSRRELNVVLTGARGLIVDPGCEVTLQVHFVPRDVRPIGDQLVVRVSSGSTIVMPVACFVRPPLLHVLVPGPSTESQVDAPTNHQDESRGGDVVDLGARLLGAVHCTPLVLRCANPRATFCLLTEQAWQTRLLSVRRENEKGVLVVEDFGVWPTAWRGGGAVRGGAWCVPRGPGLHEAMLRVLTGGVARPLQLLADVLLYSPDHVTMVAQPKDYDILSAEDLQCQYYVHVGTAYPHRSLHNGIVQLVNNSPIDYGYRWTARPWGVCACDSEVERNEAPGSRDYEGGEVCEQATDAVRLEPARGVLRGHQTITVQVRVPDVGGALGTQRTALMLVLLDVPTASLPSSRPMTAAQVPSVVRRHLVPPPLAPGLHVPPLEVCDVVSVQLEVWWQVVPLRFVLDPPLLVVPYSRRVCSLQLELRATLLCGGPGSAVSWRLPLDTLAPPPPQLGPTHSVSATLHLPLTAPPDGRPLTDVVTLEAAGAEWSASCAVKRVCSSRHPRLRPVRRLLGCVVPAMLVSTWFEVTNDTLTTGCWVAHSWRWLGEREPAEACRDVMPCSACQQHACTCHMLHPTCGYHQPSDGHRIQYEVCAPDVEGCVVTLVSLAETREGARVGRGGEGALLGRVGSEGRAALVGYRVLTPRLVLRVWPCDGADCDRGGALDGAAGGTGAVLRPATVLWLGHRTCYRLTVTNTTPLATTVQWQPLPKGDEAIHVTFIPNDFEMGSYAQVNIQVVVEAVRVSRRRLWALAALVQHAPLPSYLLVDTAVAGVELEIEWPLGGSADADSYAVVRRLQSEGPVSTFAAPDVVFAEEDIKRATVIENVCGCHLCLKYIPPPPPLPRDPNLSPPLIDIVSEPPPLTAVCACCGASAPLTASAHGQPLCVQLWAVPVRSVARRVLAVRNLSPLPARWQACVRRWGRVPLRCPAEPWQAGVSSEGVALLVRPARGLLAAGARLELELLAYTDTWGLYWDQLLLQVAGVAPLVIDVWLQAVGSPLQFIATAPLGDVPTLWISSSDEERTVRVKNTSHAALLVRPYVTMENERPLPLPLPLRLYYRLVDLPPTECPICDFIDDKEKLEPGTGVELWVGPDWGRQEQDGAPWRVTGGTRRLVAGGTGEWWVRWGGGGEGSALLVLRPSAEPAAAEHWQRPEPAPLALRLRPAPRSARLLARNELRVELNALRLPQGDVLRIRKRVRVQNTGNGWLNVMMSVGEPWSIVTGVEWRACGCGPRATGRRLQEAPLRLPPRATDSVCVELCLPLGALLGPLPACGPAPSPATRPVTPEKWILLNSNRLSFLDENNVLQHVVCLTAWTERPPQLVLTPAVVELGCVCAGDTRTAYLTLSHTSRTETLEVSVEVSGGLWARVWPPRVMVGPGGGTRLAVAGLAPWQGAPAPLEAQLTAEARAAPWLRACATLRLTPSRDHKCHKPPHDFTTIPTPPLFLEHPT